MEAVEYALSYLDAGLSVVPIRGDGSKAPTLAWKKYQSQRLEIPEAEGLFREVAGVAIICGSVSGGLEVMDFDDPSFFPRWCSVIADSGILSTLPQISTPSGGTHVYFRSQTYEGNLKLAWGKADDGQFRVAIETRGEGGYVLAPGCEPKCHEDGGEYEQIAGPPITDCPVLTDEERSILISAANSLNEREITVLESTGPASSTPSTGDRPGDQFNKQSNWLEILRPAGWKIIRKNEDGSVFWQRPEKGGAGASATTGYCANEASGDLLYVFSSNAEPFESNRAYSKFAANTLLNHEGDFHSATLALLDLGYGIDPEILTEVNEAVKALTTLVESGVELAVPEDTINQLKQIDGKFKRTWEMKRSDFARDVSRYDTSLIWYCCEVGLDIKQVVSVLYKFRLDRGIVEKHPLMAGSIAAKVVRISDHPDTQDGTLMTEEVTKVTEKDDTNAITKDIRSRLSLPEFSHLEQHGRDENAIFYMVSAEDQRIKIGGGEKLMTLKGFAAPVLRWFHKVLPTMKAWQWDACLRLMLQTCRVEEMPDSWESNRMAQWIEQYLQERPICDDEGWKDAALHGLPFEIEGKLHLHIEGLMKWIALTKWGSDGKIPSHTIRSLLRNLNFKHEKRSIWVDGKNHCRSFWVSEKWENLSDG